jgi:hypothetical protein
MEHLHYNSPTAPVPPSGQNLSTSPFTFTQLLQQSTTNQSQMLSLPVLQHSQQQTSLPSGRENKNGDSRMARTPLTIAHFTPSINSASQEAAITADIEFSQLLQQKLSSIHSQQAIWQEKGVSKSNPKSPIKLTNKHRLNNTPKIKEGRSKNKENR